jgi:DNA-binding transcriptional LysR family regulator
MDKFSDIEAFTAVVETGSFSAASDRLNTAKSVISRRVSQLEQYLGTRLLNRTTRRLSMTDAGRSFYQRAVQILSDLEEAEQSLADQATDISGRIKVAAPLSFGLTHLSDAITEFMHRHPGIELDLDLNDRQVNLVEEGFDIAVRIGNLQDSTLVARRLGKIRSVTCASAAYLAEHGTPDNPADLNQHSALQYSNISYFKQWQYQDAQGRHIDAQPVIRMRSNNGEALAAAAIAGLGITRGPTFILGRHIRSGDLQVILQDYQHEDLGMYAVYPPGRLLPRRVQALSDHLASCYGESPYWDSDLVLADPRGE